MKNPDRIVRNRNICKDCCNKKRKENYHNKVVDDTVQIKCRVCNTSKNSTLFINCISKICNNCNNDRRRTKYQENEEVRKEQIQQAINYKKRKKAIRDEIKKSNIEKLEEVLDLPTVYKIIEAASGVKLSDVANVFNTAS